MFTHIVYGDDMNTILQHSRNDHRNPPDRGVTVDADPGRPANSGSFPAERFVLPALGGAAWAVWAWGYSYTAGWWDWPSIALMFSPFVIVPLGLSIVQRPETGPVVPALTTLRRLVPLGASAAAASFLVSPGWRAAALTAPWLLLTFALGIVGVLRTLSRRRVEPGMGTDAALVFLAMGSIWVTTSRLGANPLGYDDLLVLLTAVHLHFAGFALPLVAGFTSIRCQARGLVPAWVIASIPATGLGVALAGDAEWIAATSMGLAGVATAVLLFRTAATNARGSRVSRVLITASALSLATAMLFGIGWAWAIRFGWQYFDVLEMARVHGMLNAFGFALAGLVGLELLPRPDVPERRVVTRLRLASLADLERMALNASAESPTSDDDVNKCSSTAMAILPHGFEAGREALKSWVGHDAAGIRRWPERPEIVEGTTLAVSTPVGPVAIAATLRITEVIDEPDRFGFTYAALNDHPETGHQTMVIERLPDGTARAAVTTTCGPWLVLAQLMPSVTQRVQTRVREEYLAGIAAAERTTGTTYRPHPSDVSPK